MTPHTDEPNGSFGLLACGTDGCWSIDLDESPDGTAWSLQLDGPQVYLAFALRNLGVVAEALAYIRTGPRRSGGLTLGHFGSASVMLHWDDEYSDRCFLIVGPQAQSTLRVSLSTRDTHSIAAALEQIVDDLPPDAHAG